MKTVLITGATTGIGYEFVKIFSKNKYDLILTARKSSRLNKLKKEFPKATIIAQDLSLPNAAEEVFNKIKTKKINVLINNAGFGFSGSFDKTETKTLVDMVNLNVTALTQLTSIVVDKMQSGDKIMNVASVAGFFPGPYMAVYYATKAYVLSFSEAISQELKTKGIQVSVLCPGATKTEFFKRANPKSGMSEKFDMNSMTAKQVAEIGYKGLMKNKTIIVTGLMNKIRTNIPRFLPRNLVTKIIEKIQK